MTKNYIAKALQFIGVAKPVGRKYIEHKQRLPLADP